MTATAGEHRTWLESTPAGRIRRAYGMTGEPMSRAELRHFLEDAEDHVRDTRGRDLYDHERVALTASALGAGVRISDSTEGIARVLGGRVIIDNPAGRGAGLAMMIDGQWVSDDPATAAAAASAWTSRTGGAA